MRYDGTASDTVQCHGEVAPVGFIYNPCSPHWDNDRLSPGLLYIIQGTTRALSAAANLLCSAFQTAFQTKASLRGAVLQLFAAVSAFSCDG